MSAALGGPTVSGWGGGTPPLCKLARHPTASRSWGPRRGDSVGTDPSHLAWQGCPVPAATEERGPGGLEGSAGRLQMVGAGGGRAVAGTMAGLCRGAARHGSARLGAAPRASSWAPPCTAGAERGHGGVPLVPMGDKGAASGGPGWPRPAVPPAAAVGAWGGRAPGSAAISPGRRRLQLAGARSCWHPIYMTGWDQRAAACWSQLGKAGWYGWLRRKM